MKPIRTVLMIAFAAIGWAACGEGSNAGYGTTGDVGTVRLDLTTAPLDARCAVITVTPAGGTATQRQFPLVPGQPAVFDLNNLPIGMVTLSEQVFTVNCPVGATQTPTWTSDLVTVILAAGVPVNVTFALTRTDVGGQVIAGTSFPTPPNMITEFTIGVGNTQIVTGPDDNLWFSNLLGGSVGRITPSGVGALFPLASGGQPNGITAGPDGNVWFTEANINQIGFITPTGSIREFLLPSDAGSANNIVTGRDGNLWFTATSASKIVRVSIAGVFTQFSTPTAAARPAGIAVGPDGNIWFTEAGASKIGRITPTGTITEFSVPTSGSNPLGICAGPDGNIWFTEAIGNRIGRATTAGSIVEFALAAGTFPQVIVSGPDGNLWFTETAKNAVARITPLGVVTEFTIPTPDANVSGIAAGPDGNVWFTELAKVGRIRP